MPLFQQSVQKKFIAELDKVKVENAYQKLIAHFGNPTIQENIRKAKEEQYQEGFLRELFVDVLGYVLNPQPNFNLITEQKNEKDSKKADGAILKDNKPVAVIELKSVKTTDLQSIEIQAFSYKNNQSDCVYVITSNFQKIRFYIENAIDFEEFDLFDLSKERFALLYLCLHADSVLSDTPLRVKKLSLEKEENITNKLYADYSLFKQVLFKDIAAQNKDIDKFILFKKTQKLLDRFLFIFFAEDKGLLPPNSVAEILNQWDKLKELDAYQPLYSRFKLYFGYLNSGYKGKNYDIFAYNGGLFAPDELLDNLKITDNLLYIHCQVLAHYDFNTDVDTNILGHIFEHSLNELDEVAASVEGGKLDKSKTKRKKDGVFYTPRYITKYIVESTIGELCRKEKISLGLDSETLIKIDAKKDKKIYQQKIQQYRDWLLQLTILDPACGSGAFLNQALEFLIEEHRQIDSMTAMLFGDAMIFTDNVTEILEHNIFGVDINEESVEIARLSLWLRTAKVGRKLNDLSRNIKVGNSLISDVAVAGDLAFDWKMAFPQVFEKGGFDIIIGNPPYGAALSNLHQNYCKNQYEVARQNIETYSLFFEKGCKILNKKGLLGYITPETLLRKNDFSLLRKFIFENSTINQLIELGPVFSDAKDTWCLITILENNKLDKEHFINHLKLSRFIVSVEERLLNFEKNNWAVNSFVKQDTWLKSKENIVGYLCDEKSQELIYKINQFPQLSKLNAYFSISRGEEGSKTLFEEAQEGDFQMVIPDNIYKNYCEVGRTIKSEYLAKGKLDNFYNKPKIWIIRIQKLRWKQRIVSSLDLRTNSCSMKTLQLIINNHSDNHNLSILQGIISSKLINFWAINYLSDDINSSYLGLIPIPINRFDEFIVISENVNNLQNLNETFFKKKNVFIKLLQSSFSNLTVNKKIENWQNMTFGEFRKELEKQKITIAIKELMDYQELFDTNKNKISEIQTKINQTEKAIDKLVYQLYGLTQEEIQIIENQ